MSNRNDEDDDTQAIVQTDGQFAVTLADNPAHGNEPNVQIAFRGGEGEPTTYIAYLTVTSAMDMMYKLEARILELQLRNDLADF